MLKLSKRFKTFKDNSFSIWLNSEATVYALQESQ